MSLLFFCYCYMYMYVHKYIAINDISMTTVSIMQMSRMMLRCICFWMYFDCKVDSVFVALSPIWHVAELMLTGMLLRAWVF